MSELDKLIDRMGQAVFRIETNFQGYQRHPEVATEALKAIEADLENLKDVKRQLVDYSNQRSEECSGW